MTRREQPGKQPEIRPSNHVDDAAPRWKHRFYLTPGTAVALGADEQARGAAGGQARDELGHALWRPALGVAVRRAWCEPDQRRRAIDAELREKGVGAGPGAGGDSKGWLVHPRV